MIPRHVIYCDHYPDGAVEAGSNARERKPATVSHEVPKIESDLLKWNFSFYIICGRICFFFLFFSDKNFASERRNV